MLREIGRPRKPTATERQKLDCEPLLQSFDSIALACWRDLDSCRPLGYGAPGAIPWTVIMEWARDYGAGQTESRLLADVIRILDVDRADRISSEMEMKR